MNKLILLVILAASCRSEKVVILPHNIIAKIAGAIHHKDCYAVTIGNTIRVSCSKEEFLEDSSWMRHEFTHVEQYKRYGTGEFIKRYIWFSITKGYYKNPFEVEAIKNEKDNSANSNLLSSKL